MAIDDNTRYACGELNYPYNMTNEEPLKWNIKVEHWTGEVPDRYDYIEFFMDAVLRFRHRYEYAANTVTMYVE